MDVATARHLLRSPQALTMAMRGRGNQSGASPSPAAVHILPLTVKQKPSECGFTELYPQADIDNSDFRVHIPTLVVAACHLDRASAGHALLSAALLLAI